MAKKAPRPARWRRILLARRRLLASVAAGLILLAVLPASLWPVTRYLLAWDLTAATYVGAVLVMIARSTVEDCHAHAELYDESDWAIVALVVAAAAASFVAIFAEQAEAGGSRGSAAVSLLMTGLTVALSWTFTHIVFTLHYASLYYRPHENGPGGLNFHHDRAPDYHDFLYYSFVIGCASQTGDVDTISPEIRRLTLLHGIVSFAFNTAIMALAINIGASLIH